MRLQSCFSAALLFGVGGAAMAADAQRGAKLFGQCAACHSTMPGEHMTGPSLAHLWNRKAATAPGFKRYSDALKGSDITWDASTLDKWLTDPNRLVPGTSMTFAGIRDAQARQDVIAYLRSVSEGKAAQPSQGGGMMGGRKPDLRKAPPAGQVRSIARCGDTYTVETGDGKREKVWEFNLRFKTDSSDRGPAPGKPVVLGAGMQGDRVSVIFASPAEIGGFIKQSCD